MAIAPLYTQPERFDAIAAEVSDDLHWWAAQCGTDPLVIIELGCGTGRVALHLAAMGHQVWGVDNAPAMLQAAMAKDQRRCCQWLLADFSRLSDLPLPIADAVIIANNTLSHVLSPDQLALLCSQVHHRLRPGGRLLIDTFAPSPGLLVDGREELLTYPDPVSGEQVTLFEEHHYRAVDGCLEVMWFHQHPSAATVNGEALTLRVWQPAEIIEIAGAAGLKLAHLGGDYDGSTYGPESDLLLVNLVK